VKKYDEIRIIKRNFAHVLFLESRPKVDEIYYYISQKISFAYKVAQRSKAKTKTSQVLHFVNSAYKISRKSFSAGMSRKEQNKKYLPPNK
jgi:hypothetical protein